MAIEGVVLKLDTTTAAAAQKTFEAATASTFDELQKQGELLVALQKRFTDTVKAQDEATAAQRRMTEEAKKVPETESPAVAIDLTKKLTQETKESAKASTAAATAKSKLAREAGHATTFLQRLMSVAGQSGAGKGIGLLAAGVRSLAHSMNPVGIITGLAAGALITFASNALTAQTDLGKLSAQARQARDDFSLLQSTVDKSGASLAAFARQRVGQTGFTGSTSEAIASLKALVDAGKQAVRDLNAEVSLDKNSFLDIDRIKSLGEALGLTTLDLQKLDRAAKEARQGGQVSDRTLKDLQETGLPFSSQRGSRGDREVVLETSKALKAAEDAVLQYEVQLQRLKNEVYESTKPFEELNQAILDQIQLDKLGNKEREVTIRLRELEASKAGGLTAEQQKLKESALRQAQAYDAVRDAAKGVVEAEKDLAAATRAQEKAAREAEETAERLAAVDARRSEILQQINDDTQILLATNEDEIRAKTYLAKLNDALRQSETTLAEEAGKQIEAALQRAEEAERLRERLVEIKAIGADVGATIGQGFLEAARSGQTLLQALGNIAEGLLDIAAQKLIIDALAKLGASIAGSLFAQGPTPSSRSGSGGPGATDPYNMARGGFLPSSAGPIGAARGVVLDRYQTFAYGGKAITTNEGGASTPEAVMPLARDQYGRLGVQVAGAAPSYVVNLPGVRSAEEARRIRPTMVQMLRGIDRANSRQRSGLRAGQ